MVAVLLPAWEGVWPSQGEAVPNIIPPTDRLFKAGSSDLGEEGNAHLITQLLTSVVSRIYGSPRTSIEIGTYHIWR